MVGRSEAEGTQRGRELRTRLEAARLMLLFTPDLASTREPLAVLEECLELVDIVQVRVKPPGGATSPAGARETWEWTRRVLSTCAARGPSAPLVIVDDRVDVAAALAASGCAGCHVGVEDCPPAEARSILGEELLLGLSTHSAADVARACREPVNYLGFGPVHATLTKGYGRGLGAEAAWIAQAASSIPVFPVGGIDATNAVELATVGRAAVGSAILSSPDPARAARELRAALTT